MINNFKNQEAETVRDICKNVIAAPVFRPAKDTVLDVNFPNNELNEELFKLETISVIDLVYYVSTNVDVFLCKISTTGRIYISSDFHTNESYFVYYIILSNVYSPKVMLGLLQKRVAQVSHENEEQYGK